LPSLPTTWSGTPTTGAVIWDGLIRASGRVEEWPSPGGRDAAPYGMTATPDGSVWYSESGVKPNTMVPFQPADEEIHQLAGPLPAAG